MYCGAIRHTGEKGYVGVPNGVTQPSSAHVFTSVFMSLLVPFWTRLETTRIRDFNDASASALALRSPTC
jgi:hypothetical protein